jgi:hypothetical protein
VGAQDVEEAATAEPGVQEPASSFEPPSEQPAAEPAPEEPALQLKLDDAGVEVAPGYPPRTVDGYTLEEMERRVKLAKVGVGISSVTIFVGGIVATASAVHDPFQELRTGEPVNRQPGINAGIALVAIGGAGMIASGILLGVRKHKLRRFQEAGYGKRRHVQWDLTQSRLVF